MVEQPWTPEQFQQIVEALQKGAARENLPDKPPAYATGKDAEIFARAAELEVDARIRKFLPDTEIDARIEKRITERLKQIGLNTDEDHIEETGEMVRRTIRWQKYFDKVSSRVILAILAAVAVAVLKLVGVNVSFLGMGEH